ncbi:hypothetical protein F2Q69_00026289 [Brassica cretica]|uniref:Uncharacterized protein n=1 Tax=Brassica cretica TaxID=69181 RepID=A0A8S9RT02_BRACR|nr:hypothetical protein F2Q69_00026289 [Brassica cretica]
MDTCWAMVTSLSLAQNASASLFRRRRRNRVSPPLLVESAGASRFLTDRLEPSASVSVESSYLSVVSPIVSYLIADDASLKLSYTTLPLILHLSSATNRGVSVGGSTSLSTAELDEAKDGWDEEDINVHNGSRYIKATIRPPGVKASKGFGKKIIANGKRLTEFHSLWSIRQEDIAAKERVTKMKLLESLVAKQELVGYEEALKKKLITEFLSN